MGLLSYKVNIHILKYLKEFFNAGNYSGVYVNLLSLIELGTCYRWFGFRI